MVTGMYFSISSSSFKKQWDNNEIWLNKQISKITIYYDRRLISFAWKLSPTEVAMYLSYFSAWLLAVVVWFMPSQETWMMTKPYFASLNCSLI